MIFTLANRHFISWPSSVTMTLNLPEQMFQINNCANYGLDKLNLWPFSHLTFKCDLDLQPNRTIISNGTSTPQGELCQRIFKSVHTCRSYSPDNLNLRPFHHLTFSVTLTFNLPKQMFQMALLLLKKNSCVKIILEFIIIIIIGFFINMQVQGPYPQQRAPFQATGLLHPRQISHQISRCLYHEGQ